MDIQIVTKFYLPYIKIKTVDANTLRCWIQSGNHSQLRTTTVVENFTTSTAMMLFK